MNIKIISVILVILVVYASVLNAAPCKINDKDAVHIIMGEAAGEPYEGKLWVACVLRNRNSTQGCYGFKVSQAWLDKQSAHSKRDSIRAWNESIVKDVTGGCNMFGGQIDDAYFRDQLHLKPVRIIGHQKFYKSR